MVVAIDGPAGAGKSTVARQVAAAFGFTYIDTGAMYRAVALLALRRGIATEDEEALSALAGQMALTLHPLSPSGMQQVEADGEDITGAIRTPEVSQYTSAISVLPSLRSEVVTRQRALAKRAERGVVLDGRDIGTVVFPDAEVKIFLTASPAERARRRADELRARGVVVEDAEVLDEQRARDERDSHRAVSPLKAAPDATLLETDGLTVAEVVERILDLCRAYSKDALSLAEDR